MRGGVVICALVSALCATSQAQDVGVIADGAGLSGHWTCSMEHTTSDLVLRMTGHTTFASDGRYEATGLGLVHFGDPEDQVRWVARSSGWYNQNGETLIYSGLLVDANALPPVGMIDRTNDEIERLYASIVGSIEPEPSGPQTSQILSLDSRQLVIRSDGEDFVWNCLRPIGDF